MDPEQRSTKGRAPVKNYTYEELKAIRKVNLHHVPPPSPAPWRASEDD